MRKDVIIIKESIEDVWDSENKRYFIEGIEVVNGDYHNASKWEAIVYPSGGYTTYSPNSWYAEIDEVVIDHLETSEFYNNNFKRK